jgi:hypothetical protein
MLRSSGGNHFDGWTVAVFKPVREEGPDEPHGTAWLAHPFEPAPWLLKTTS